MPPRLIYVAGLPRAGSTLLCQLLSLHPQIESSGHSSPLCQILIQLRHQWSDNEFLLAQLDVDFARAYARLPRAWHGFVDGWFADAERPWVVDKNRGWLAQIETVQAVDPGFRMLVCVRELGQVLGSIEAQHARTRLLDFPDHLAHLSHYARADKLLAADGLIGGPLKSIEALQEVPEAVQRQVYYVVFEHLVSEPVAAMQDIHRWLGLPATPFDPLALPVKPGESDSHYRYKYPHRTFTAIRPPAPHPVPPRIARELRDHFGDFYRTFFPGRLTD
ncbi:sulfotransferase family protein [Candidatus Thiodictyon syntrophicum]|jgi:sulfotransferase|uniref:Sulfotransferase family protein n=1 Tax=Candidatus Thiodictyon syntrophicum TaxID=1166950 RepID=A0A2K8U9Q4_9GAMM|nr:sulfotransferase [Candidatus Thiodictyon syntrophicum]AUB82328.1 sulfotransferase family protein [Candidatus Thiodictyon syntrophicum]